MSYQIITGVLLFVASVIYGNHQPVSTLSNKPEILFLLGGQSNMAGNGFYKDLPKTQEYHKYRSSPENVSVWNAKEEKWSPLKITAKFGPDIAFAHTLSNARPDTHIGIVKYAVGGSSMDKWQPGEKLYKRLIGDFQDAQENAPNATLAAMLWHQGESDSDTLETALGYQEKFIKLINAVRKDTGKTNLLFIYGQINPASTFCGYPRFSHANIVRKAQEELPLKNTIMITTDDCEKNAYVAGAAGTPEAKKIPKNEDGIHYSATGQIKMGKRLAEMYLQEIQ